jgi:hypothetical protein
MRTLVSTFLVGICLVAAPALAQQHPWVPSGAYTSTLPGGDTSPAQQHPWLPSGVYTRSPSDRDATAPAYGSIRRGDNVESFGWRTGKPASDDLYDDACHSSHSVFACPGTP